MKHIPTIWRPWLRENSQSAMPDWLASLNVAIRAKITSSRRRHARRRRWNDRQSLRSAIFVECKGPRESFSQAQEDWVWAAHDSGLALSQIAVSLRPF